GPDSDEFGDERVARALEEGPAYQRRRVVRGVARRVRTVAERAITRIELLPDLGGVGVCLWRRRSAGYRGGERRDDCARGRRGVGRRNRRRGIRVLPARTARDGQ